VRGRAYLHICKRAHTRCVCVCMGGGEIEDLGIPSLSKRPDLEHAVLTPDEAPLPVRLCVLGIFI